MNSLFTFLQIVVLSPVIGGSVYVILGASFRDTQAGAFGIAGAFSFYPTKVLTAALLVLAPLFRFFHIVANAILTEEGFVMLASNRRSGRGAAMSMCIQRHTSCFASDYSTMLLAV
jgi:hypothetical protein